MDGAPYRWQPLNQEISRTIDWTKNNEFDEVFRQTMQLNSDLQEEKFSL